MPCCHIGCDCDERDLVGERSIALRTKSNCLLHIEIQWCKKHSFNCDELCVLKECTSEDLLKAYGY